MSSVKDIVSSVFKRYEGEYLTPERIRNECSILSKATDEDNPGDPGRTARDFFNDGFVQRDASSNYCYDSSKISDSLIKEFSQFENLYNRLPKDFNPTAVLKIPLGNVPEDNCIDYLASELKKYKEKYKSYGIHYFGIKYSKAIVDKNINISEIVQKANESDNWKDELRKMIKIYNIAASRSEVDYESDNKINVLESEQSPAPKATKPAEPYEQIVFYGVPGSGKSYKIDNEKTDGASDYQKQKVVFHPDYTNSDFIGQIIPKMKETGEGENKKSVIEYSFKPGPFTTILRRALRDKKHQYYLLIEEINRGNAAAIFGDLFQLLDRDDDGWSCSPVNNDDINFYIASEYEFWEDKYSDSHPYSAERVNHPDGTEPFSRNTGIMLPPNLSIYATMNTNDQNVFTLDNAFNRRFLSEYISNKEDSKNKAHCNQFNLKIGETGIYWGNFRNLINKEIIGSGFINAEDKQLGLFFIKKSRDFDGITAKDFSDKVLKYLWHDVFKRDKNIFKGSVEIKSFEDLIDNFNGKDAFRKCFNSDFATALEQSDRPLSEQIEKPETSE